MLKSPDPRHLCLLPQGLRDHQPFGLQRWRKCKMCKNIHQLIWCLKIHKSICHDDFLRSNKQVTCGETQVVAADRSLNLAPIVRTPRSIRFWSVNRLTCLTSISSDTNVCVKCSKPWSFRKFAISSSLPTPSQPKITKKRRGITIFNEDIMLTEILEERYFYI